MIKLVHAPTIGARMAWPVFDDEQRLCFALALWNGRDPIIKERLFGLTNSEGNHGEDVKEYYFYLDSTPTHSYMKWLYKYPQREYPYLDLVATNRRRSHNELEYELIDTVIFKDDRYFDVFVEYAKETPEEILIRISVSNRGPEPATLHLLPTRWFRNTWSWWPDRPNPALAAVHGQAALLQRYDMPTYSKLRNCLRGRTSSGDSIPESKDIRRVSKNRLIVPGGTVEADRHRATTRAM